MIKVITKINRNDWSELVKTAKTASFFSTPSCYDFYNQTDDLKPFVFGVEENGILVAILCGYTTAEGKVVKQFFSRRAIVPGGLLLADNCNPLAINKLLETAKASLRKKAIYIELRNYHDYADFRPSIEKAGFIYQKHLNFHIPTPDVETALKKLSSTKRRDVKVTRKNGAEILLCNNNEDLKSYYALLEDLYATRVKTPLFPFSFFEKINDLPEGKVFLVKHEGRVLGGSVCVELPGRILYEWFVCGLDREIKNVYPSTLATWGAIEYAAKNGFDKFDMMGAGKPDEGYGVRKFKAKFGGELVEHGRFLCVTQPFLYRIGKKAVEYLKK